MTIPFLCVLATIALAYLSKAPVMIAMSKAPGGYNNHNPREQQAKLEGWGKRAVAAHQNSFEALAFFAPCVFINHLTEAATGPSAGLAIAFVVSRLAYHCLFLANLPTLRSLIWASGLAISYTMALLHLFL